MLKLKLQYFGHLIRRADSLEKILMLAKTEGKRKRGQQRTIWLDSITDPMDINSSKLGETVKDRGAWCAVLHGVAVSDMTEQLENNPPPKLKTNQPKTPHQPNRQNTLSFPDGKKKKKEREGTESQNHWRIPMDFKWIHDHWPRYISYLKSFKTLEIRLWTSVVLGKSQGKKENKDWPRTNIVIFFQKG